MQYTTEVIKFYIAKKDFLQAGRELLAIWEDLPNTNVKNYPSYLPSFEDLLSDLQAVELEESKQEA